MLCIASKKVNHFQRHGAMERFVEGTIGNAHRATSQLPKRTIRAPFDFEIADDECVRLPRLFLLRLLEPRAQQANDAIALCG